MKQRNVETRRGIKSRVLELGEGSPILYLHGAAGLQDEEPLLERLAERHLVLAPEWPGYGESGGEERIEDMLDFALHGWDLVEALDLAAPPDLIGHSMGGMIAAEMACLNPRGIRKLVLASALGLWIDEQPIPDLFAMLPFQMAEALFNDAKAGERFLTKGVDFSNMDALQDLMIGNSRRLGTASKILFPIPNRRVSKRLYRLCTETLVLWGRDDAFVPPVYADRWCELLPNATLALIDEAGHMLPYEQPGAAAAAVEGFLA